MESTTFAVHGMTCMGCAQSVKRALENVPGVTSAEVSLEQRQATIRYAAGRADVERLKKAVADAGFDVP